MQLDNRNSNWTVMISPHSHRANYPWHPAHLRRGADVVAGKKLAYTFSRDCWKAAQPGDIRDDIRQLVHLNIDGPEEIYLVGGQAPYASAAKPQLLREKHPMQVGSAHEAALALADDGSELLRREYTRLRQHFTLGMHQLLSNYCKKCAYTGIAGSE